MTASMATSCSETLNDGSIAGGGPPDPDPVAKINRLPRAGETSPRPTLYLYYDGQYAVPYLINYKGFVRYDYDWPPDVQQHVYRVRDTHLWVAVGVQGPFTWDLRQDNRVKYGSGSGLASQSHPCEGQCSAPPAVYEPTNGYVGEAQRFTQDYGPNVKMYGRLWTEARVLNGINPPGTSFAWEHQIRWNQD